MIKILLFFQKGVFIKRTIFSFVFYKLVGSKIENKVYGNFRENIIYKIFPWTKIEPTINAKIREKLRKKFKKK